ncbi:hypothetical protein BV378_15320 [Nostoc sp. RF31YmG]|nr:hypothetical protein BV378_15320 [Nostoc sp. RF31YmG]
MHPNEILRLAPAGNTDKFLQDYASGIRDFLGTNLCKARLKGCDLRAVNLEAADLRLAYLDNVDLRGANLAQADLYHARLYKACLSGTLLNNASVVKVKLNSAKLCGAFMNSADLSEASLTEASLQGADLSQSNLRNASLVGADLRGANLVDSDLRGVRLAKAKLAGADLTNSNLRGVDLTGLDLTGVDLSQAKLDGATIEHVKFKESNFVDDSNSVVSNQCTKLNTNGFLYNWEEIQFRSIPELKIAQALDQAQVLFLPNCLVRLNGSIKIQSRVSKEPDFLVCYQGKWGILEVDGHYHTPERRVEEQERERLFRHHGIRVIERFDASRCDKYPQEVVKEFLQIIESMHY